MVETTSDALAAKPNAYDQAQNSHKEALSQETFQQLYDGAKKLGDGVKNQIADGSSYTLDSKHLSDKGGQSHEQTLTLAIDPRLKILPYGSVRADGSIAFDGVPPDKTLADAVDRVRSVQPGVKKDANGHVVEVDYANGQSRKFGYDDKGNLNEITDLDGRTAKLDPETGKWLYEKSAKGTGGGDSGSKNVAGGGGDQTSGGIKGSAGNVLDNLTQAPGPDYVNAKVGDHGSFSYSTSDGKDNKFNADGSSTRFNTNDKSTVKKDVDGNVTEIDYGNGKNRQFEYTKDGNGDSHLAKYTDTDGKSYNLKDGKWLNADGSDSGLSQLAAFPDGQFRQTNKEGQSTTIETDLSKWVENPNKSVLKEDENGKISEIRYSNGKMATLGYSDGGDLNQITGSDGKTLTKGADGKWTDESGKDTGIKNVSLQADGSYTYVDKDNHLVMNDTDGNPKTTTETIDQIKKAAQSIHDAENHKTLWMFDSPDGGKVNDIIKSMSPTDRLVLEQQYEQMYGKKLTDDISHTLDKKDAARANESLNVANLQEDAAKYIPDAPGSDGKNQRQAFLDNMNTFLDRAHQKGMSDQEIADTLSATQRLLEAKDGKVSETLREQLAQQIMAESAHPERTDQGNHLTCNATDIETRTWFNKPSVMANMVADVALNGFYTATDGKKITIPPQNLVPDGEAVDNPPIDSKRSFASQIIQATVCNDVSQRETPPKYYTQLAPNDDVKTGEYWTDANGKPLIYENGPNKGKPMDFDGIGFKEIAQECKRLTGDDHTTFRNNSIGGGNGELDGFKDEKDLQKKLEQAKKDGKMPIIIGVTSNDPLFGGGYPSGDTSKDAKGNPNRVGGNHVVCIDDYNPDTGMVHLDNSWGSDSDKWVPLHDLYQATTA